MATAGDDGRSFAAANTDEPWVGRGGLENAFGQWLLIRSSPVNPAVLLRTMIMFHPSMSIFTKSLVTCLALSAMFSFTRFHRAKADHGIQHDQTGKVAPGLRRLISYRDAVNDRYALLVTGEKHDVIKGGIPVVIPFYSIRIVDRESDFDYVAFATVWLGERSGNNYDTQSWAEKCISRGRLKVDSGPINEINRYQSTSQKAAFDDFLKRRGFVVFHIDPFDDMVIPDGLESYVSNEGMVEDTFFNRASHVSSQSVNAGDVESTWHLVYPEFELDLSLLQSAKKDFLPVEVKYQGKSGFYASYSAHHRCEWKKHKQIFLPSHLHSVSVRYVAGRPKTVRWYLKYQWLVNEEVPVDFLQWQADDLREPIRRYFNVDFDRYLNGKRHRAAPWQTPEDLGVPMTLRVR